MKKYLSIIVLLSLFVVGCSEQASVNSPVNNVNTNEPDWIALPQAEGMQVNTEWTASNIIYGPKGGSVESKVAYKTADSYLTTTKLSSALSVVLIYAKIEFAPGAFSGTKTITMTLSDQNTSVKFGPSMQFNADVFYNVTYTGLNLKGIDPSTVKFAYLAVDGSVVYAKNEGIKVDLSTGTLSVYNALIPHFSRYGFINGEAD